MVREGSKRLKEAEKAGKDSQRKVVQDDKNLVIKKDSLFDIFPKLKHSSEDKEKRRAVEKKWGIKISKMEQFYYEDQCNEILIVAEK